MKEGIYTGKIIKNKEIKLSAQEIIDMVTK